MWTNQHVLGDTVNKKNDLKDTKQANNAINLLSFSLMLPFETAQLLQLQRDSQLAI